MWRFRFPRAQGRQPRSLPKSGGRIWFRFGRSAYILTNSIAVADALFQRFPILRYLNVPLGTDQHQRAVVLEVAVPGDDFVVAYAARKGGGRCRASMKMSPFLLDRKVPLLRPEDPIPSCDDCAACSGTRQDYPAARATTARGLDGTRRKQEPHIPHKREWEFLESATGAISIEVRMGTFLTMDDSHQKTLLQMDASCLTLLSYV